MATSTPAPARAETRPTRSAPARHSPRPRLREPLDPASPLWDLPNVILSPHTASHSLGQNEAIFEIFLDNLARFRGGQKLRNDVDDLS